MSFIVKLTQPGGCDYTIGCGVRVLPLSAQTMGEAQVEVETIICDDYGPLDTRIADAIIYEVSRSSTCNMKAIYERLTASQEEERQARKEERDRAELARLKARYPGG